ncbi:MAG: hypothetical protein HFI75_08910 [Lachnospiraceae bacterium]|nr:hypothetical protein [Lachnospiraceae bacterium]
MTTLLECREWLRRVYGKYSLYINAGIRFITGILVFMLITYRMGYMTRLKNPVIPLLMALICTFLPANIMVVFAMILLLAHLYALSWEIALAMLVIFLILYLIYYRFSPRYAFVLMLTPVAFTLKIPYIIPVILGLAATPVTAVPVAFGSVGYYLLHYIFQYGANAAATSAGPGDHVQKYVYVFANAIKAPELYLYLVTMTAALFLVYFIRRLSVDKAWLIAIFTGAISELVFMLAGNFAMDISINVTGLVLGTILAILLAFVLQFFVFNVDYSRTEYVQFEDDEYYYYVKAIPKVHITKREKTVKQINPQKKIRMDSSRQRNRTELDEL